MTEPLASPERTPPPELAHLPEGTTLGVEEEFQLLDAETGALTSRAFDVLAEVTEDDRVNVVGEMPLSQVEVATPVCRSLAEVHEQVRRLRGVAAAAAGRVGVRIAACGTPPIADWREQRVDDDERYAPVVDIQGHLIREQLIAGLHVHVGVADRDRAVAVLDRTRTAIPVLVALAANSPYWAGEDAGFASWRTIHWSRWPVSGPPPLLGNAAGYDRAVDDLVSVGVIADPSKVYWDARLSSRFPTVEFRATDVCLSVDETVLLAGLVRALTRTALHEHDEAVPVPDVSPQLLRAASWRAARDGIRGRLVSWADGRPEPALRPAEEVVGALLDRLRPALRETGDEDVVCSVVERVLHRGSGADRQRAAFAGGGLPAVARYVGGETVAAGEAFGLTQGEGRAPAQQRALA